MRYAYAITSALLLGGAAASLALQDPLAAQTAQNAPGQIQPASAPRAGAPGSFADMVAKLQPAVVNISTSQRVQVQRNPFQGTPFGELFGFGQGGPGGQGGQGGAPVTREAQSLGSGFIISADGYVVTNNHVIAPARNGTVEEILVTLSDRREYKAKLIGRDPASDLALLKIEGANLPFVRFGDSNAARVGDWVVAIGNPFGLGGTVTAGIVSAVHRATGGGAFDRFIQTDASINQGNSGGPMFDLEGNVIGINSQILSPTGGNVGIGFAIPAEQAKPIIDTLRSGGTITRGYLGVQIQPVDRDIANAVGLQPNRGEIIASVVPGEAAARAGLRQGDVVVSVGGKEVTPDQTLSFLIAGQKPGTRVPVEILRDGKRQTIQVQVGNRPSEDQLASTAPDGGLPDEDTAQGERASASLGLSVTPLTPAIARNIGVDPATRGVVIVSADPSSDAAGKGLRRGDVIISVNRTAVATAADVSAQVQAAKRAGRDQVLLLVVSQAARGATRFVTVGVG